tara:strand:+ start:35 stop:580 length:546 start_codon:yes stop_codon:yes gene_type:complete
MEEMKGEQVLMLEEDQGQERDKNKEPIPGLDQEREALLTIGFNQDREVKQEALMWMDLVETLIVTNNMPRARCSRINSNKICLHLTRIGNKILEDIVMDMIKRNQLLRIKIPIHRCKWVKIKDNLIVTSNMPRTRCSSSRISAISSSAKSKDPQVLVNNKCLTPNPTTNSKTCITLNLTTC